MTAITPAQVQKAQHRVDIIRDQIESLRSQVNKQKVAGMSVGGLEVILSFIEALIAHTIKIFGQEDGGLGEPRGWFKTLKYGAYGLWVFRKLFSLVKALAER